MDLSDVIAVMALVISGIALYKPLRIRSEPKGHDFSSKKYFFNFNSRLRRS